MNKLQKIVFVLVVISVGLINAFAQTASNIVRHELSQAEIDKIVKKMSQSEGEFREALKNYVYNRFAVVQTIGLGGQVTGEFRRDSFITFSADGARTEKILFAPIATLDGLAITPEDIDDLGGLNPFAIEPAYINQYSFNYLGKEKVDELDLYVFDVTPKVIPDWKKTNLRLFTGRIWVDDHDLQIVKSKGKAVPEGKQRFPVVETWRENIDGKYWFPAYSLVTGKDGELVFDNGFVARMKMRVKYTDYRQGRSDVVILDDDDPRAKTTPTPTPTPKKPE